MDGKFPGAGELTLSNANVEGECPALKRAQMFLIIHIVLDWKFPNRSSKTGILIPCRMNQM